MSDSNEAIDKFKFHKGVISAIKFLFMIAGCFITVTGCVCFLAFHSPYELQPKTLLNFKNAAKSAASVSALMGAFSFALNLRAIAPLLRTDVSEKVLPWARVSLVGYIIINYATGLSAWPEIQQNLFSLICVFSGIHYAFGLGPSPQNLKESVETIGRVILKILSIPHWIRSDWIFAYAGILVSAEPPKINHAWRLRYNKETLKKALGAIRETRSASLYVSGIPVFLQNYVVLNYKNTKENNMLIDFFWNYRGILQRKEDAISVGNRGMLLHDAARIRAEIILSELIEMNEEISIKYLDQIGTEQKTIDKEPSQLTSTTTN